MHREFSATSKRETDEFEYGSLERILSRQNLLQAMNRVISNKGSHGVDGMTVYELKQFLQTNWLKIREDIFNNEYKPMPVIRFRQGKTYVQNAPADIPQLCSR